MTTEQRKELNPKGDMTKEELNLLGNLLAILHSDGGHYQEKHGTQKALHDAIDLIHTKWVTVGHLTDLNEALSKIQRLEEIIKAADEVIKCYPKKGLSEKYGYDYEQALEHYNKLKI